MKFLKLVSYPAIQPVFINTENCLWIKPWTDNEQQERSAFHMKGGEICYTRQSLEEIEIMLEGFDDPPPLEA